MTTTIVVVDDDQMTLDLVSTYLEREHFVVHCADNGRDALELVREHQPNLVVLDLMLPRVDGLDICRILRRESDVPIIILTAKTTEDDVLLGLELGADDYIKKPFSPRELVARVRTVLRRQVNITVNIQLNDERVQFGGLMVDFARHEVTVDNHPVALTASEFSLLRLMVREPGRVFSRTDLLERTRSIDNNSLERTIDYHMMNLRRKIEPDAEKPRYIQTVFGVGYKFTGDVDYA